MKQVLQDVCIAVLRADLEEKATPAFLKSAEKMYPLYEGHARAAIIALKLDIEDMPDWLEEALSNANVKAGDYTMASFEAIEAWNAIIDAIAK